MHISSPKIFVSCVYANYYFDLVLRFLISILLLGYILIISTLSLKDLDGLPSIDLVERKSTFFLKFVWGNFFFILFPGVQEQRLNFDFVELIHLSAFLVELESFKTRPSRYLLVNVKKMPETSEGIVYVDNIILQTLAILLLLGLHRELLGLQQKYVIEKLRVGYGRELPHSKDSCYQLLD
ncbi:hypothetical protein Droror1_Dr00023489 [Drosera rotundifolia]